MRIFEEVIIDNVSVGWKVTEDNGHVYNSLLSPVEFYAKEANDIHNALVLAEIAKYDYIDLGELNLWMNDEIYSVEAAAILAWYKNTCTLLAAHLQSIEEYVDPNIFINTLPKLEL